jgi:hypothetical protein
MMRLVHLFLQPPAMPEIYIPVAARLLPHIRITIAKAIELAYHRGCLDGFVMGVLLAVIVMSSLQRRSQP